MQARKHNGASAYKRASTYDNFAGEARAWRDVRAVTNLAIMIH